MAFIVHGASPFPGGGQGIGSDLIIHQPTPDLALVCATCAFTAAAHEDLRDHYKTEWHRHNLKRKVAGLAPISLEDFESRVSAYAGTTGESRGKKKEHLGKKAQEKAARRDAARLAQPEGQAGAADAAPAGGLPDFAAMTEEEYMDWKLENSVKLEAGDSLFDRHRAEGGLVENLAYMSRTYGFFVPFVENVADVEGLAHYLAQKVSVGNVCLWCNKTFHSLDAVRRHMVDKGHCKIQLEGCEEEFACFYDRDLAPHSVFPKEEEDGWVTDDGETDSGSEASDDEDEEEEEEEDKTPTQGKKAEAARLSKKHAAVVNNLVLSAAGRSKVLGHRAFRRFYAQKLRPEPAARRDGAGRLIVAQLASEYRAAGVVTGGLGPGAWTVAGRAAARAGRQMEKQVGRRADKWWLGVAVRKNKFHGVRRQDYHA